MAVQLYWKKHRTKVEIQLFDRVITDTFHSANPSKSRGTDNDWEEEDSSKEQTRKVGVKNNKTH